jgi:hypothetical protein
MLQVYVAIIQGINALALVTASLMMATQWAAAMGERLLGALAIKLAVQSAALLWFLRPERRAVMTPLGAHPIH